MPMDVLNIHGQDTFWWSRHTHLIGKFPPTGFITYGSPSLPIDVLLCSWEWNLMSTTNSSITILLD